MNHGRVLKGVVSGKEFDPLLYKLCPYDDSHQIHISDFLIHIHKCRGTYVKTHGEEKMKICVFNSEHHIPKAEYEEHLKKCCDQYDMLRFNSTYNKIAKEEKDSKNKGETKKELHTNEDLGEWDLELLELSETPPDVNEIIKEARQKKAKSRVSIVQERK